MSRSGRERVAGMSRNILLDRARKLRAEIQSMFDEAEHWNRANPMCVPLDPDPSGQLEMMAAALDRTLAGESANDSTTRPD